MPRPQFDRPAPPEAQRPPAERPHFRQLALQGAAAFAVLSLAWPYFGLRNMALPWLWISLAIGGFALLFSVLIRNPWWWGAIHASFAPMAWSISRQGISPEWFLVAFFLLLLVYRGALNGQIPLYFSNRATVLALEELVSTIPNIRFIDLGAGIGSVLSPLASALTDASFVGLENAPATWAIARMRVSGKKNCKIRMTDFWNENLAEYNVVYAFLSPAPMADLWEKAQGEMQPGTLFISNSFAVPDVAPSRVIEIADKRGTKLYCYQR